MVVGSPYRGKTINHVGLSRSPWRMWQCKIHPYESSKNDGVLVESAQRDPLRLEWIDAGLEEWHYNKRLLHPIVVGDELGSTLVHLCFGMQRQHRGNVSRSLTLAWFQEFTSFFSLFLNRLCIVFQILQLMGASWFFQVANPCELKCKVVCVHGLQALDCGCGLGRIRLSIKSVF